MAKSVNKVILLGNVGKDPEIKYTPSGTAVANFSIATGERYKDKEGQFQERTEWHNIVAWDKLAEIIGNYVKKGSKLYLEGRLQTRSWDDKQTGEKKYRTEIVATDISLLSGRGEGGGGDEASGGGYQQRSGGYSRGQSAGGGNQGGGAAHDDYAGTQITDDDIPF
ncbi:MAG TPA: single-stranded DNA-binding protein [Terriglobales bacterium]